MARWKLSCKMITRTYQKLNGRLLFDRKSFFEALHITFEPGKEYEAASLSQIVEIDQGTVFSEANPKSTVPVVGNNIVSVRCTGSNNRVITVRVFVACDGTNCLLFVIFKGQSNRKIEKNLRKTISQNMYICCQTKGWMGELSMKIWNDLVWKP